MNVIDDDKSFDILEEEGQPGWFEKVMALVRKIISSFCIKKNGHVGSNILLAHIKLIRDIN